MSKFFTRNGDDGTTGLLGNQRVPKHHIRIQAIGDLDEATAALGVARAQVVSEHVRHIILTHQRKLYHVMAEVASTPENADKFKSITDDDIQHIENEIEMLEERVPPVTEFITPGDSISSATLALARTIIRRAERSVTALYHKQELTNQHIIAYLNRLSSLCFVLERLEDMQKGVSPTIAKED